MTKVNVTLEGVAFACTNKRVGRAEVAIIRHHSHELTAVVTRTPTASGFPMTFSSSSFPIDSLISFETVNPDPTGVELKLGAAFDRSQGTTGSNDVQDWRWILDMEGAELHGQKLDPTDQSAAQGFPLTHLHLSDPLMYTAKLTTENYAKVRTDTPGQVQELGLIGITLGAEINADIVSLKVGDDTLFTLDDGADYTVTMENLCDDTTETSDFPFYYKPMSDSRGWTFDLRKGVGVLSRHYICHVVSMSKTRSTDDFS